MINRTFLINFLLILQAKSTEKRNQVSHTHASQAVKQLQVVERQLYLLERADLTYQGKVCSPRKANSINQQFISLHLVALKKCLPENFHQDEYFAHQKQDIDQWDYLPLFVLETNTLHTNHKNVIYRCPR